MQHLINYRYYRNSAALITGVHFLPASVLAKLSRDYPHSSVVELKCDRISEELISMIIGIS